MEGSEGQMKTDKRRPLNRTERFAAVILDLKTGTGLPIIDRQRAKGMTAKEIVEEFEKRTHDEHIVPHAIGGPTHPANMQIIVHEDHAPKTKIDVREIAKTKRIMKEQEAFRARMLVKVGQGETIEEAKAKRKYKWPKRKMQSRNSFQKRKP
jgi:hypothetical protein